MSDELHYLTIAELAPRIRSGELSPPALTEALLERCQHQPQEEQHDEHREHRLRPGREGEDVRAELPKRLNAWVACVERQSLEHRDVQPVLQENLRDPRAK